ncbi:hypothetical protein BaRGS_00037266 [Batillaria attramentaria]|uniref:Uncharacterized protein n=1 Tax=Batillaria attramentaria TaxID=370345 RepID=A0ABD0JA79_9CAEN
MSSFTHHPLNALAKPQPPDCQSNLSETVMDSNREGGLSSHFHYCFLCLSHLDTAEFCLRSQPRLAYNLFAKLNVWAFTAKGLPPLRLIKSVCVGNCKAVEGIWWLGGS